MIHRCDKNIQIESFYFFSQKEAFDRFQTTIFYLIEVRSAIDQLFELYYVLKNIEICDQ